MCPQTTPTHPSLMAGSFSSRPQRSSISSWEALVGVMMTWIKVGSSISFVVSTLDMKWTLCLMGEGKMTTQGILSQGQTTPFEQLVQTQPRENQSVGSECRVDTCHDYLRQSCNHGYHCNCKRGGGGAKGHGHGFLTTPHTCI